MAYGYGPGYDQTQHNPSGGYPPPPGAYGPPPGGYPGEPAGYPYPPPGQGHSYPASGPTGPYPPAGYGYPPPPPPPRYSAPWPVHSVAVSYYLCGGGLVLGAVAIVLSRFGYTDLPEGVTSALSGAGLPMAALIAVVGLLAFPIGRRLQHGVRWARTFVMVLSALSLAVNALTLVSSGAAEPLSGLVLPILSLVLLNTPPARSWFHQHTY